ncbi:ABC transporter permease [Solibacillus sp. FSL K6-1554]|uniref:ABC transporter permease n=1 Tax=Solibacillus sp. FSL K6-1554 TaxID=2921472 RepID=UPI0030F5D5F5
MKLGNSNRLFIVPIIAALVLGLIFMTAILPMVKMDPKNVPIGLVVVDEGEMGANLANTLLEHAPELVEFSLYDSVEMMGKAMDEKEVYGGLVLPADFSAQVATLQTETPERASVQIYINEGANATAATLVQTALSNIVTGLNTQLSGQILLAVQAKTDVIKEQLAPVLQAEGGSMLAQVSAMISPIQPSVVQDFANPIQSEIIKVNETGKLGNAPLAFMTVTWFVSLIGAAMLYLVGNKRTFSSKGAKLKFNTIQSVMPFIYAFVAGYMATWYSTWLLGFDLEYFNRTALFLALCISAFMYMIFATVRWLKLPSIVIYVLLTFFSMSAVQLAPEMIPAFYKDYIISWLPLRYFVEGLKEVLFFSHNVINSYSIILIWVLVIAFILVWVKNLSEKTEIAETEEIE